MHRLFLLLPVFILMGTLQAFAANVYKIENISIEAVGQNATEARQKAIAEGEKEALKALLKKLLPAYASIDLEEVEATTISSMVIGMDVIKEKTSATHYKADIDLSFDPNVVDAFVTSHNLSVKARRTKPIAVIPVMIKGEETITESPWKAMWKEHMDSVFSVQFSIVDIDAALVDIFLTSDYQNGWDTMLEAVANDHQSDQIVLAIFEEKEDTSIAVVTHTITDRQHKTKSWQFVNASMEDMTKTIMKYYEQIWESKRRFKTEAQYMEVILPVRGLSEWLVVKKDLESIESITTLKTKELSVDYVLLELYFETDYDAFFSALESSGWHIISSQGDWILRRQ